MKKSVIGAFVLVIAVMVSGCYNATVKTGLDPSARVIENSFASSWIYGLVPPKTVEASSECTNGVAEVDTKLSFVNMLVGSLTLGIYTPMSITVTCAAASADLRPENSVEIDSNASSNEVIKSFEKAAELAVKNKKKIHVVYK